MVRSILKSCNVPKTSWPETVNWSVHILNRSLTITIKNVTFEEAWSGRKPIVNYFRICGSIPYAHILHVKGEKPSDKDEKRVFLDVSLPKHIKVAQKSVFLRFLL